MSGPSATQIMKRRHLALVIVRSVGLLMVVYAAVYIVFALGFFYAMAGGLGGMAVLFGSHWNNMFNPFWHGVGVLAPGLALVVGSRRLARRLVPASAPECPQCGYAIQDRRATRCPECGYALDFGAAPDSAA